MAGVSGFRIIPDKETGIISFDLFGTALSFKPIRLARSAKSASGTTRSSAASEYEHLQKQIGAFEKLTQHAISKFSSDKLHANLTQLMHHASRRASIMADFRDIGDIMMLNSVSKVRHIVSRIKKAMRQTAADKDGDADSSQSLVQLVHYFEGFFQDVQYVRELKKYFSEKVHLALYESFYDPTDVDTIDDEEQTARESNKKDKTNVKNGIKQEKVSRPRFGLDLDGLNEKERLSYAVDAMFKLHSTWERLCIEGQLNEADFEAESRIEIHEKYGDTPSFELILRLLPDMFVKSFKCSELAKVWLQNARSVYIESASRRDDDEQDEGKKRDRIATFTGQLIELQNAHREKQTRLASSQQELISLQNELTKLDVREQRLDTMRDQLDAQEQGIHEAQKSVRDLLDQRSQLLQDLETHRTSHSTHNNSWEQNANDSKLFETRVAKRLKELELQLIRAEQTAKTTQYARNLMHADYALALEIRPNYVASRTTADSRYMQLKNEADTLMRDKLVLERRLTLVRTNLDKMKEIYTRFARPENADREQTNTTH